LGATKSAKYDIVINVNKNIIGRLSAQFADAKYKFWSRKYYFRSEI
jgi:hypothetical protein